MRPGLAGPCKAGSAPDRRRAGSLRPRSPARSVLIFRADASAVRVAASPRRRRAGPGDLAHGPAVADEGEHALSVGLGFARFSTPEHDGDGGALTFDYERGLSDAFWLRVTGTGAVYRGGDQDGTGYSGNLVGGLTYVIDVLRYVPYLHAGVGAVVLGGDSFDPEIHPMARSGSASTSGRRAVYGLRPAGRFRRDALHHSRRPRWRWAF